MSTKSKVYQDEVVTHFNIIAVIVIWMTCCTYLGVEAAHFRGATIQWRPYYLNGVFNGIEITHHISYARSVSYCDDTAIAMQTLLGISSDVLICQEGCTDIIGTMQFYCTDFSLEDNWSVGQRSYVYSASGVTYFEASFAGGAWVSLVTSTSGSWEIRVKGNLTIREDTGRINSSPTTIIFPETTLTHGCNYTLVIPVNDADEDVVRCRWAVGNECAGVCQSFDATLLQDKCELQYEASGSVGQYVVALQVEDFASVNDTQPLSSVPVQFIVSVVSRPGISCDTKPQLVAETPLDGSCFGVAISETYMGRIVARAILGSSIRRIFTISPPGFQRSTLTRGTGFEEWFIDISWTPNNSSLGANILCFIAQDTLLKIASTQSCIIFLAGVESPRIVPNSFFPMGLTNQSYTNEWRLEFNSLVQFKRPSESRYIRIFNQQDVEVFSIDVSVSEDVVYPALNTSQVVTFTVRNTTFMPGITYYVAMDSGIAVIERTCELESLSLQDSSIWNISIIVPDPCLSGPCDPNAFCVRDNLLSSNFTCTCNTTFTGDGFNCTKPDPCLSEPCDVNALCLRKGLLSDLFNCTCKPPFEGTGFNCSIPDPCLSGPCDSNAFCVRDNLLNSNFTCTCNPTYTGDGFNCTKPDPCLSEPCDIHALCLREGLLSDLFNCTCEPPFEGTGFNCLIPDPCLSGPCDSNAYCVRDNLLNDNFTCTCNTTYTGDGFNCTKPDPCLSEPCDVNALCLREGLLSDLFNCTCEPPFEGTGFNCSIPDPCLSGPCDLNAYCVRDNLLNDNFTCTCNTTFIGDGFNCTKPDPCLSEPCDINALCLREGLLSDLFNCTCKPPFEGTGFNCSIADPCLSGPCDSNAYCVRDNLLNSNFTCTCNPTYTGDGFNCTKPDPCLKEPCDVNALCVREGLLSDLFNCTCEPPFEGTGFNCSIPDPCLSGPCDSNAYCVRDNLLNDNFTCTCNPTFIGDGFNCTIPDPCLNEPCDTNATCKRESIISKNFTCECLDTYFWDGFNCTEIGPLLTYRSIIISVPTVVGTVTVVLLVGAIYGYIKTVQQISKSNQYKHI